MKQVEGDERAHRALVDSGQRQGGDTEAHLESKYVEAEKRGKRTRNRVVV